MFLVFLIVFTIAITSIKMVQANQERKETKDTIGYNQKRTNQEQKELAKAFSNSTVQPTQKPKVVEAKKVVAIDPGHQLKGNNELEPIGPGATTKKKKVTYGTSGVVTKVAEYQLNLEISLKLKEALEERGYQVVMTRETNEVNLSNRERAEIANEANADIFIRIHADGSENQNVNGASTLYPSQKNPYVSEISSRSKCLSQCVVNSFCEETGANNRGAIIRDDMSGINWCKTPVTILEMGFMSNKKEDKMMQQEAYQKKMVTGIVNGIEEYFSEIES